MNNIIMLPIIIPFFMGTLLILFAKKHLTQRILSSITAVGLMTVSIYIAWLVYKEGPLSIGLGGWEAPFGIAIVADNLAAFMVVLTSIVSATCLFFAFTTIDKRRERYYFYPLFFYLVTGVNGAFLTGDLFNLFVFFEVMLLASYALMVTGSTKFQLRETFKYAVINAFSSMLFLVAIAYVYGILGTVNFAHMAERVAEVEQTGVLQVVAILLFLVFATKGALFPLYFWLPHSYVGPPTAVTALFGGLLTKVGVYCIIRMYTLVFTFDISFTHQTIMLVLGGLTMLLGVLGAVAQFDYKRILSFHIISQIGYMIMGIGLNTALALAGAIYFLAHNMIVKTGLILMSGATEKITGTTDLKKMGGLLKTHPALAWSFLILGLSIAGIPPLSGFFGKFPLIVAAAEESSYFLVFLSLFVGMLTLFSMIKIFMNVYWGAPQHTKEQAKFSITPTLLAASPLVVLTIILGLFAEPFFAYTEVIAEDLLNPSVYIQSVLKE
ncbi:Na+/H+ antiporter subunit D [Shouchella lehensis]|uniref:Na(+)/H(+) antiporter subunit n=2 Tax=Shouchella lehensis TaxID=300825 RepID=A0A060M0F0_9BACI|nr:Na+/H+ antiporter subunit D [Shouchella lehensis]AIC94018.1 Na(+)/H(+) antiporter subunit [Shouchella lehensis G1]MBG9785655.1 monovalent cation/H+ antiporter subunit D [Shouchella lehensis]TES48116.1 Na+/H+ antiporter subunit D [Shouchella lehensis]